MDDKIGLFFMVCLASYLEEKGVLNRKEFAGFLKNSAHAMGLDSDANLMGAIQTLESGSHLREVPRE
jgi:hypothetical protein